MPSKKSELELEIELEPTELTLETDDLGLSLDIAEAVSGAHPVALGVPSSIGVKIPTELSTIESLITDIDDMVEYLTWVIYGKNGTGKTTLLSTADGVLILAAEDGTLSIKGKAANARKLKIDTWDKLESVYWLLKNGEPAKGGGIRIRTSKGDFTVKYLAIDTVTKLSEVCMRNTVLGDKARDPSRDVIKKTLKDWGDSTERMKYWLQQFEELPIQRVWIFQENSNSDDVDSDEYSIFPAINKGLRTYVLSEADIIARTYIAKTEKGIVYRLNACPNPSYVTKDRTGLINGGAINNPNLEKLYNVVFGKTEE